ncbi:MAG TPA: DEAD/DEAH box helicase family protein [Nitrososphaerales archaeon]
MQFELVAPYEMSPGQKEAVEMLMLNYLEKDKQTLLGITGSGKTFVMANLINRIQKPTLIIAHNKTLAAHLYTELKDIFRGIELRILFLVMIIISLSLICLRLIHIL